MFIIWCNRIIYVLFELDFWWCGMLKWDYKSKVLLDVLVLFKSRVFLRLIRKNEFVICVIDIFVNVW